uniref:BED-type domain-containing protein n=1 Tax=Arundo donax TaxID=35708 RepID=A0A0A9B3W3_ARUDO
MSFLCINDIGSTSASSKRRKLRSDVWKEIEAIYENRKVVKGRCTHCYEVFFATRTSGTSRMRRHLDVCEPRARMHNMVDKMKS